MNEIRTSLAECVYSWACQTPLAKNETKRLMTYLQKYVGTNGDGTLDDVTVPLLMAFLYCVDVSGLEPRAEDRDGKDANNFHPPPPTISAVMMLTTSSSPPVTVCI